MSAPSWPLTRTARPGPGEIRALVGERASLVAVEHGEVVGFVGVKPGHFYRRDFIDLLFVAARRRRDGVGRALLQAAHSGVLTGLDDGDPELVFFHDVTRTPPGA
jgi:GNAT superfamily N-acetyltransferase